MGALSRSSVAIPPILQVMLFLRGMHSCYQDLLSQFASKHKDLAVATIDSIVCDAKFMDEFKLVDGSSKPRGSTTRVPSVAAVTTDQGGKEFRNPFEWLATYDSGFVKQRWQCSLRGGFYCAFCNGKEKHHALKCPLLGDLGLKIVQVDSGKDGGSSSGSGGLGAGPSGGTTPSSSTPPAAVPAAVCPPPAAPALGSASAPAGLTAAIEPDEVSDEDSADDFHWYGDDNGDDYKPNGSVSPYFPSCSRVSTESFPPLASSVGSVKCGISSDSVASGDDIVLPSELVSSLLRAVPPAVLHSLIVADTGATDHMLPDRLAFISYKSVRSLRVWMGNNSYAPILGRGTAIVSLNGQCLLVRNVLHVPALRVPLYSLRAHLRQRGCGFVGSFDTGIHVYFPGVVLSVDMSTDCHLSYEPLGKSAPLSSLHYVQPWCAPIHYPAKGSAFPAGADPASPPALCPLDAPVLTEDEGSSVNNDDATRSADDVESGLPTFSSLVPKQVRRALSTSFSPNDLALISKRLQVLSDRLSGITVPPLPSPPESGAPVSDLDTPRLLSSLSQEDDVRLVHRPGSVPPPVRPCDCSNGSDTKTHWTPEELHHALGCRCFRNYKHILQTSLDGQWIDGSKFPVSLGAFTTIPKAPR